MKFQYRILRMGNALVLQQKSRGFFGFPVWFNNFSIYIEDRELLPEYIKKLKDKEITMLKNLKELDKNKLRGKEIIEEFELIEA